MCFSELGSCANFWFGSTWFGDVVFEGLTQSYVDQHQRPKLCQGQYSFVMEVAVNGDCILSCKTLTHLLEVNLSHVLHGQDSCGTTGKGQTEHTQALGMPDVIAEC